MMLLREYSKTKERKVFYSDRRYFEYQIPIVTIERACRTRRAGFVLFGISELLREEI